MAGRKRNSSPPQEPAQVTPPADLNIPPAGSAEVVDTDQAARILEEATPKAPKKAKVEKVDVPPAKLIWIRDDMGRKRQCAEADLPYFQERGFSPIKAE